MSKPYVEFPKYVHHPLGAEPSVVAADAEEEARILAAWEPRAADDDDGGEDGQPVRRGPGRPRKIRDED